MARPATFTLPRHLVGFLRDCYEADNRETALFDLRQDKVQHFHLLQQGAEFLTGTLDLIPLDWRTAVETRKAAQLCETEKTLLFGAFLLLGNVRNPAPLRPRAVCAPLLLFPATIELAEPHAFIRVNSREQRVNTRVLAALLGDHESATGYLDEILACLPQAPFESHRVQQIISAFEQFLPVVDASALVQFPQLVTSLPTIPSALPASRREATAPIQSEAPAQRPDQPATVPDTVVCLPACCLALVPNSPDTRGVLTELAHISTARTWPAPLRALTGAEGGFGAARKGSDRVQVPASLSHAQRQAVHSATRHPLSLIIGPPGTGKSFTLAALTVEQVLRGASVLLATRTNQALDVLADKIETLLGDRHLILRGGRSGYSRQLKESLAHWLHGPRSADPDDLADAATIRHLRREVITQARAIERLETALGRRADWEKQWGDDTVKPAPPGLLARWLRTCRLKLTDWQLAQQGWYWDLMENYQRQLQTHHQSLARLLRASIQHRRQQALQAHRREFVALEKALRARTNRKQDEWFAQINRGLLLRTFPVWMSPVADINRLLPLEPGLFDLAVVDEATQCDTASCLPVFFRARRAVVTGDPRQLRHLSFLSRERQRLLAEKWNLSEQEAEALDYREQSLLDWVNETIPSQAQVTFLDEHFRSRPPIIAFSNREFYQDALKVMTRRPDTLAAPSLEVRQVAGHRREGGPNQPEAEALMAEVVRWVESEKELKPGVAHSLGVLSPFREQVDHLFAGLNRRLDLAAIEKHRLRVGTAHTFQGEERDIMFLSLVLDRDAHPGSLRYLERPDVFNVSITRARNLQVVFSSVAPGDLPARSLLRRYLETIGHEPAVGAAPASADAFLREVREAVEADGFRAWPGYRVAGLPLDLLVEKAGRSLGIDLVGYPGELAPALDLEKYRLFQRAGLWLFPLSLSAWHKDRTVCMEALRRWMAATPTLGHHRKITLASAT